MLRRDFIKSGSLLAGGAWVSPESIFSADTPIKLAVLGTGWWGTDILLASVLTNAQFDVVALCDVSSTALTNASEKVVAAGKKAPKLFNSYEEMYNLPGLDAVVIATPTHWHALQFIAACEKGLHVFLEKPISYDIREGQAMLKAHQKANNVVIVDFPRAMVDINAKVRELLQSGEAGKIYQVEANINNPEGPLVEKPVPSTLDYERFCGPAPKAKFLCDEKGNKSNWRGQHVFSRGVMADWGIHYINNIRIVLGLDLPSSVSAIGGTTRNFSSDNPDHLDVRFDFAGLPVYWSHKAWGYQSPSPERNIGVYYYGDKATIFADDMGWQIFYADGTKKNSKDAGFDPGSAFNLPFEKMFNEFAEGIRKKSNAGITNTFEKAQKTTCCVIYADMAFRTKSELIIDPATLEIKNNKQAQALLKREYRAPYVHPYKG